MKSEELKLGCHRRYLCIDVSSGDRQVRQLPEHVLRAYLGGAGLGVWLLLRHAAAVGEPLSPAATLGFVFSPLVGSPLTTSAKFAVVSKSPLTQRFNDSLVSSGFAIAGKATGFDALLITGRAAQPSVLVIEPERVTLHPARDLWGTSGPEAERRLKQRFPGSSVAVIGVAGENAVRFATISHDGRHAGRGGNGAVLGSKNLKAVVVRGDRRCAWADPEALTQYARDLSQRSWGSETEKYRTLGTAANLLLFNRLGVLPTRNFQGGSFPAAEQLAPESLQQQRASIRSSCRACTIGCTHQYALAGPGQHTVRVEYENLYALGPLCGVEDPEFVLQASQRCDNWGLDTISAGATIAFAMECVERGLLDAPWLRFGQGPAVLRALDLIGTREGIGDWLADGSRLLAHRIGRESIRFAPQVKGLELPGYEPRALQTMALGFAVGARGADHNRSSAYEADFSENVDRRNPGVAAAPLAAEAEDRAAVLDSLILCKFLRKALPDLYQEAARMLQLVMGWRLTPADLQRSAARIANAKKCFNMRAGWTPAEDTLPARFLQESLDGDPRARLSEDVLKDRVRQYWQFRGWDAQGRPTQEQVDDLLLANLE